MHSFGTGCKIRQVKPDGSVVQEGTCTGHQRQWHGDIDITMLPKGNSKAKEIRITPGSTLTDRQSQSMEFLNRKTGRWTPLTSTWIPGKKPAPPGQARRQEYEESTPTRVQQAARGSRFGW